MNYQTTERIKESLVSSNPRGASGSDLLSVRGPNSKDESDFLSEVNIKDDSESLAEASFAGDADENIKDPCAVCFTNRNFSKKATHFCNDCGLLGHFLCEQCLGFHKKFTNHKSVKSFAAAKYKRGASSSTSTPKQSEKIKKLQDEITELKAKLNMYQYHMDPITLEKKFGILEDSLVNMLSNENAELRTELAKFTSGNTIKSNDMGLQRKLEKSEKDIKRQAVEMSQKDNEIEIDKIVKEIKQLKKDNDDLKKRLLQSESKIKEENNNLKFESEITRINMEQQIETLIAEKESIETEKKKIENDYSSLRIKMEQQMETLIAEKESIETEKKKKENDYSSLRTKTAYELKKKIEDIKELKNNITTAESKIKSLESEKESLTKNLQQEKNQRFENELILGKLKEEHKKLIGEKDELSKVVEANIMNDNPNITDSSDENTPMKLSEKFSELYDNEWTDAYEEAENELKTEEKGIAYLYKTLLDVFDFCKTKSEEHAKHIRDSVMTLPNAPRMISKSAAIGVTNQRQLKEVRKSFAPMLIETVFQNYFNEKKLNFTKKENTGKYIKKCVEICWLMNSHDPPVILETSVVDGKSFDGDKFRTYTKTGKLVDYVVWPPMLLHKGGPLLCKGLAQGK